jgi:hypothetical protein
MYSGDMIMEEFPEVAAELVALFWNVFIDDARDSYFTRAEPFLIPGEGAEPRLFARSYILRLVHKVYNSNKWLLESPVLVQLLFTLQHACIVGDDGYKGRYKPEGYTFEEKNTLEEKILTAMRGHVEHIASGDAEEALRKIYESYAQNEGIGGYLKHSDIHAVELAKGVPKKGLALARYLFMKLPYAFYEKHPTLVLTALVCTFLYVGAGVYYALPGQLFNMGGFMHFFADAGSAVANMAVTYIEKNLEGKPVTYAVYKVLQFGKNVVSFVFGGDGAIMVRNIVSGTVTRVANITGTGQLMLHDAVRPAARVAAGAAEAIPIVATASLDSVIKLHDVLPSSRDVTEKLLRLVPPPVKSGYDALTTSELMIAGSHTEKIHTGVISDDADVVGAVTTADGAVRALRLRRIAPGIWERSATSTTDSSVLPIKRIRSGARGTAASMEVLDILAPLSLDALSLAACTKSHARAGPSVLFS